MHTFYWITFMVCGVCILNFCSRQAVLSICACCGTFYFLYDDVPVNTHSRSGSGDMEIEFGKFNERKSEDNETMETRSQSQSIRSFTGYEPRDTNYLRNKVRSSQMSEGDIEALIAGTRKYMSKYEKHHSLGSLDSGTTALSRGEFTADVFACVCSHGTFR